MRVEFILQCRHAKTFPTEPEDIKMPSIEWEEIPKGQKGWCDLDREGNVNWYYDQFSGEWVECPLPVLGIGNCIRHYDKFWGEWIECLPVFKEKRRSTVKGIFW